ncbi:DUF819 family protein [Geothrix sp. SG200]|uniref:DUF819 family protein n=1 Tax=Geothrix sp. SG200 TaxID=2922865 RepID=UPI001FAC48CB|nr:DUF819 family protein [Geothrix sp. SG200]
MTLIKPDDTWALWAFLFAWAAVSIHLEQRYRWASAVSGCILALGGGLLFANLGVVPIASPVYDSVWTYVVPMAVPLLLFTADLRKIWRESGRVFGAFHISTLGTVLGTILATALLGRRIPEIGGISAMFSGSYIGGSVNYVAMSEAFRVSPGLINAGLVADNLLMAVFFGLLTALPSVVFIRRKYPTPLLDQLEAAQGSGTDNPASSYWGRNEISLKDLSAALACALLIVTVSVKLAAAVGASGLPPLLKGLIGQKYLLITALTAGLATAFPRFLSGIRGARELGTLLIYLFFVVIGVPASISNVLRESPILLAYAAIILAVNLLVTLLLGKWTRQDLEVLLVASNATIGGPTTAAAMAIGKGWNSLVLPALLTGVWGYVIASYLGYYIGTYVGAVFGR